MCDMLWTRTHARTNTHTHKHTHKHKHTHTYKHTHTHTYKHKQNVQSSLANPVGARLIIIDQPV